MSEIPQTGEKLGTGGEAPNPETEQRPSSKEEKRFALFDDTDRIREELGILDGQVTLTFVDERT